MSNTISFDSVKHLCADTEAVETFVFGKDPSVMVSVHPMLTMDGMIRFVEYVVGNVIDLDDAEFIPEALDFSMRIGILTHYANFEEPDVLEDAYALAYAPGLMDEVLAHINEEQLDAAMDAVATRIDHMLEIMYSTEAKHVKMLVDKMNEVLDVGGKMLSGIDASELGKVLQGISTLENMDEASLVKAVLAETRDNTTGELVMEKAVTEDGR